MKHIVKLLMLSGIFALVISYCSWGQSYLLLNPTTDKVDIYGSQTDDHLQLTHVLKNASSAVVDTKVRVQVIEIAQGHVYYFCDLFQCNPDTDVDFETDYAFPMQPGEVTNNAFYIAMKPKGNAGNTTLKITFLNANNASDFVSYTVTFHADPTSVDDQPLASGSEAISGPTPSPVSETAAFALDLPAGSHSASLEIYNMTGKMVQSLNVPVSSKSFSADLSSLPSGAYYYSLVADGRRLSSKPVMILH